jgi:hypothetical protein
VKLKEKEQVGLYDISALPASSHRIDRLHSVFLSGRRNLRGRGFAGSARTKAISTVLSTVILQWGMERGGAYRSLNPTKFIAESVVLAKEREVVLE